MLSDETDALLSFGHQNGSGTTKLANFAEACVVSSDSTTDITLKYKLLDLKTQQTYYSKIVERYMQFCAASGGGMQLEKQFASLSLSASHYDGGASGGEGPTLEERSNALPMTTQELSSESIRVKHSDTDKELSSLLLAMRKLREGVVASNRRDDFSVKVYVFCIRVSILTKHVESYHPALLHLLRVLHPASPHTLSSTEFYELVGYLVLDSACRQQDFAAAYSVRHTFTYGKSDAFVRRPHASDGGGSGVDAVLHALVHDNYHLFWKLKQNVDGYKSRLMEFAEDGMTALALKCLGRTYFTVEKVFVTRVTAVEDWKVLQKRFGVGWELDGENVIIRRPKGR
ncbi:MAG: hypothetical protein M1837_005295 [Sclerophora amabilis]|nr:MAG: hypothetical protein M1837_005295 [Sclerophora amabilis]